LTINLVTLSRQKSKSALNLNYGDIRAHFMLWQKALILVPLWAIPVVIIVGAVSHYISNVTTEIVFVGMLCSMILYFVEDLLKRRISLDDDNIYFGFRVVPIKDLVSVDLRYKKSKFAPSTLVLLNQTGGCFKLDVNCLSSNSIDLMIKHLQNRNSSLKLAPILPALVKCRRIKPTPFETPERLELPYASRKIISESFEAVKASAGEWLRVGPLVLFLAMGPMWLGFYTMLNGAGNWSQVKEFSFSKCILLMTEVIQDGLRSVIGTVWDGVGHATNNAAVTAFLLASLVFFAAYMMRFLWRPTALVADTEGLQFILRFKQLCLPLSRIRWTDIVKMSLNSSTGKSGALLIEGKNKRRFSIELSFISNDDKGLLLKRIEANVPNCAMEHELTQSMLPNSDHSYTEIWLQSLNQPRERKTLEPLEPGQIVGENRFEVLQSLGVGGQGTAYLCRQLLSTQAPWIVLKETILPVFSDTSLRRKAVERFDQEAKLLMSLEHPGIVRLSDYFIEDHRAYLMLEHVKGSNLRDLVAHHGPLGQAKVRSLAAQMCEILTFLHGKNVVHRDFTPDNLMLSPDGRLKLIDFNVAQENQSSTTGTIVGKHAYLPPEQFRGKATTQSDLYAFGATLFFLLTGKDPEPISQSSPVTVTTALDGEIDSIVKRATALQVSKRYQSAQEILADLQAWGDKVSEPLLAEAHTHRVEMPPIEERSGGGEATISLGKKELQMEQV
jgi:tRNA A-37 threonylcarbamoyl transferase component Bud32